MTMQNALMGALKNPAGIITPKEQFCQSEKGEKQFIDKGIALIYL
jgi:hypothetical protein